MLAITVQVGGMKRLLNNLVGTSRTIEKEIDRALRKSLFVVEREVKSRTPVTTGRLRDSIGGAEGWRWVKGRVASIGTNVRYAIYVEEGTKPHVIFPRVKKALFWKGALHPVKRVMHPGTKPVRFMERGATASLKGIEKCFNEAMEKVVINVVK